MLFFSPGADNQWRESKATLARMLACADAHVARAVPTS